MVYIRWVRGHHAGIISNGTPSDGPLDLYSGVQVVLLLCAVCGVLLAELCRRGVDPGIAGLCGSSHGPHAARNLRG